MEKIKMPAHLRKAKPSKSKKLTDVKKGKKAGKAGVESTILKPNQMKLLSLPVGCTQCKVIPTSFVIHMLKDAILAVCNLCNAPNIVFTVETLTSMLKNVPNGNDLDSIQVLYEKENQLKNQDVSVVERSKQPKKAKK